MSEKILITGENETLMKELDDRLPREYDIRCCQVSRSELINSLRDYVPDLIIVCMEREENGSLMLYQHFFKEQLQNSTIPLLVAGSKEDTERFETYVEKSTTTYLYRPLSYEKIYEAVSDILHKKQLSETEENDTEHQEVKEPELQEDRKCVLVVDDDANMLRAIKNLLADKYKIALASNGRMALKYVATHHCDVILLDYLMPEMDGPGVLSKIRQVPHLSQIPVVFLTGVDDADMVRQCLYLKPQGYLLKPVRKDKLFSTLDEVLEREGDSEWN